MELEKFERIYEQLPKNPCRAELRQKPESDSIRSAIGYLVYEQGELARLYQISGSGTSVKGESIDVPIAEITDVGLMVNDNESLPLREATLEETARFYKALKEPFRVELILKSGEKILGYIEIHPWLSMFSNPDELYEEYQEEARIIFEKPCVQVYSYIDWNYCRDGEPRDISLNKIAGIIPLMDSRCRGF